MKKTFGAHALPIFITVFLILGGVAWAAVDAFFAGRAVRMTKTAASTCATTPGYNCKWFDTSNRERFWNGTESHYTVNANAAAPTSGRWVLTSDPVDGGLKWTSPTDGGLVLP